MYVQKYRIIAPTKRHYTASRSRSRLIRATFPLIALMASHSQSQMILLDAQMLSAQMSAV